MNRRSFVKYGAITAACIPLSKMKGLNANAVMNGNETAKEGNPICIFIKPLEKFNYDDIALLLAEAGFDGADISFRKGGLIAPETAKEALPKLIKAFEKKNLTIPMAVSGITDPDDPETKTVLQLMADSGIKFYRLGAISYNNQLSIKDNLGLWQKRLIKLCELNQRYGLHGAVQNHVGSGFGAPVWDTYSIIKDCDARYLGFQYDVRHAVAEGMGSWPLGMEIISGHIRTTCIKDFTWIEENKRFKPVSVPLGEGIVDYKKYFELLKKGEISGPVSIHYEFPLLSDQDTGKNKTEQIKIIIPILKRDLAVYKQMQTDYSN